MKKRYIFLSLIACIYISNKICSEGLENSVALLVENNFYLPKETCICTFRKTIGNGGSGEGWIYGEDSKYYYGPNVNSETERGIDYYILKKGEESKDFEKFIYTEILKAERYQRSMLEITQEEYDRNTEQLETEFLQHGKGVKCRKGRSRWLGGC